MPASVASYQTLSWDLDDAYIALNDLANMFQPGMLDVFQQQLVGPNGGEPLNFQKDIFGPLGDRITIISDFKKPIKEDSQRMLLAVALEDTKAFQATLNKLIDLAGGPPKKREFQGTTIYDFEIPEMPNGNGPRQPVKVKGTAQPGDRQGHALRRQRAGPAGAGPPRRGAPPWPTAPSSRRCPRDPGKVSTLTFVQPEEQARLTYDMIKSGQFEKALAGPGRRRRPPTSRSSPRCSTRTSCPTSPSSPSTSPREAATACRTRTASSRPTSRSSARSLILISS